MGCVPFSTEVFSTDQVLETLEINQTILRGDYIPEGLGIIDVKLKWICLELIT